MRILILNRVLPPVPGASGRVLAELVAALRDAGHRVHTVTYKNIPHRKLPYLLANLSIGLRAVCARRADRIVIMTDPPLLILWAPLLKWRHRAPVVYWCQDTYPDLFPAVGQHFPLLLLSFMYRLKNCALRAVTTVIAIGRCMETLLAARYPAARGKITVINNWAEQTLSPLPRPLGSFTVLYAGNMGPLHPALAIIAAARLLQADDIQFIIMGGGTGRAAVEAAAQNLSNVVFKDYLPTAAAHQLQASAHLHVASLAPAATGLCVPVKTMSAVACHRPCLFLGEAQAEPARLITQYQAGQVIPCDDGAALAAAIRHYKNDPDAWSMAVAGAARAHAALPAAAQLATLTTLITKASPC